MGNGYSGESVRHPRPVERDVAAPVDRVLSKEQTTNADERDDKATERYMMNAIEVVGQPSIAAGGRRTFHRPGFVTNVGRSLQNCAHIKRGHALRSGDSTRLKKAKDFTDKFVSSAAHASYWIRGNTLTEFPDEGDLKSVKRLPAKHDTCFEGMYEW